MLIVGKRAFELVLIGGSTVPAATAQVKLPIIVQSPMLEESKSEEPNREGASSDLEELRGGSERFITQEASSRKRAMEPPLNAGLETTTSIPSSVDQALIGGSAVPAAIAQAADTTIVGVSREPTPASEPPLVLRLPARTERLSTSRSSSRVSVNAAVQLDNKERAVIQEFLSKQAVAASTGKNY